MNKQSMLFVLINLLKYRNWDTTVWETIKMEYFLLTADLIKWKQLLG